LLRGALVFSRPRPDGTGGRRVSVGLAFDRDFRTATTPGSPPRTPARWGGAARPGPVVNQRRRATRRRVGGEILARTSDSRRRVFKQPHGTRARGRERPGTATSGPGTGRWWTGWARRRAW